MRLTFVGFKRRITMRRFFQGRWRTLCLIVGVVLLSAGSGHYVLAHCPTACKVFSSIVISATRYNTYSPDRSSNNVKSGSGGNSVRIADIRKVVTGTAHRTCNSTGCTHVHCSPACLGVATGCTADEPIEGITTTKCQLPIAG